MRAALVLVFAWFFLGGIAHFAFTVAEMRAVPDYISWPREAVIISGVFELLGALGLLWPRTRRPAAWGLFVLTIAVTPANIHMYQQHQLFADIPVWALAARLPLQLALLGLIAWIALRSPGTASGKPRNALPSATGPGNT
ncbi:MAG: DoxX family protein [Pseudomonadota bacterium]